MTNTNATNFRKNVFEYLNLAIDYNDIIHVSTKNGNAVVMNEEDYNGLMETLYLLNNAKTRQDILEGMETDLDECIPADEVEW